MLLLTIFEKLAALRVFQTRRIKNKSYRATPIQRETLK